MWFNIVHHRSADGVSTIFVETLFVNSCDFVNIMIVYGLIILSSPLRCIACECDEYGDLNFIIALRTNRRDSSS